MSDINEKSNFVFEFQSVTKLFEEQVRLHPDKCAVASSKESFTYAQLNERANRIANSLIEKGVGCEKIVGVVLERCCDFYAVRQGILKAGGAFAVAAPDYPDDRVQFIFEDAGVPFIITTKEIQKERQELFSRLSCTVLLLEELLENPNAGNPDTQIKEHDLCYCIYTSGSTGKPKGVMIEHINLANFVNPNPKNAETYGYVSRGSVSLSMAAMTFDVSVLEEFLPLTNGMTAVIASDEEILNPIMLGDLIVKNKVDIMTTTPTYLSNMIDLPQLQEAAAQIRVFDVGAEAFPPALFDKIHAVNPDAYIMNGYGPTETTISCTMKVITDSKNITIGEPNGNVQVYVVDKENRILPDGENGELVIAGLGVGRGYINLPEKTAEVFITLNGERAYKTGDLAKITPDGEIEFFGRIDNQIKLRGLRIELGEIEEVVNSFEGIITSITVPVDNKYLCCYFMADRQINVEALTAYASESLAHYMVPDVFIQLEKMPLTQNGKIDKKALPKPVAQPRNLKEPENPMQKKIFDIVAKVVENDFFGIDTSFYKAGLSSISAMKLCVLISEEFGVTVKTSDIHENNTVEKLEKYVMLAPKLRTYEKREVYPLTGSQKGIFAECSKNPESTVYNIPFLFELDPTVDTRKLSDAIARMVSAHSYLLTQVYLDDNGEMVQRPGNETFVPEVIETTNEKFASQKESLVRPFKLEKGRLLRVAIYVTEDKKYLFTDFHHIIADGNSYDIIFEDINKAYMGEKLEKELLRLEEMKAYEKENAQYELICGIDEAGRGPLAGPVAAGAVILPKDCQILYLNDSKKLSEKRREELFLEIKEKALAWSVGIATPQRIDEINILQATYEAMREAIKGLGVQPGLLLNDAVTIPGIEIPQIPIVKGDAKSVSIAAASILAKVTRDHMMMEYDEIYPGYGFGKHKGYGTKAHIEALKTLGPCPIHRGSFIGHFVEV